MECASPCINMTVLRETHGVVVSTGNGLGPYWKGDLSKLGQVDNAVRWDAQLAVEMRPADEHIAAL